MHTAKPRIAYPLPPERPAHEHRELPEQDKRHIHDMDEDDKIRDRTVEVHVFSPVGHAASRASPQGFVSSP